MGYQKSIRNLGLVLGVLALAAAMGCASAAAPPPPPAAVGSWNVVIETPIGNNEATLMVGGVAEALTGSMSAQGSETPLRDVLFADGKLTFGMTIDMQGTALELTFDGMVDGDSLTGAFQSDFGPAPVTGTRAVQ
jgi:hypothetical protein